MVVLYWISSPVLKTPILLPRTTNARSLLCPTTRLEFLPPSSGAPPSANSYHNASGAGISQGCSFTHPSKSRLLHPPRHQMSLLIRLRRPKVKPFPHLDLPTWLQH